MSEFGLNVSYHQEKSGQGRQRERERNKNERNQQKERKSCHVEVMVFLGGLLLAYSLSQFSPGHSSVIVTPACPGSGHVLEGTCPEHLPRGIQNRCSTTLSWSPVSASSKEAMSAALRRYSKYSLHSTTMSPVEVTSTLHFHCELF